MDAEGALVRAIGDVLRERGLIEDSEMIGDWHVMVEVTMLNPESRGSTKYANIIPGENGIPIHRVLGLIDVCTDLLNEDSGGSA